MSRLLHCTIGPVQGFIDQARRTRDLWAGSFLLSCLAGVAMREIRRRGGRIVFPVVENDPLLAALEASGTDITGPLVGSLPNRFKAELPDDFGDIAEVRTAVLAYWSRIAETVRRTILGELVRPGTEPGLIWSQQIGNFFEIAWVAGLDSGDGSDGAWLDRRKNWRNHARRAERGDHCMLITELQELSGEIRALDRARQNDFWDDVRRAIRSYLGERNHTYDTLELRPTERLSAIALVKRLFPILKPVDQRAALGFLPAGPDDDIGSPRRSPVRYWSSLSSLAAAPWMAQLHRLDAGAAIRFRRAVRDAEGEAPANSLADQHSQIERLRALGDFGPLDGKLLYDFALRAEIAALDNVRAGQGAWARQERTIKSTALEALQGLKRAAARVGLPEPSPFYAILRMDGDEAGRLLGDPAGPGSDRISTALAFYTAEVQATVDRHQGVLIYAGGNDVLALFSIEQVLEACWALREAYLDSFRRANAGHATTSAGVAFAHMGVPFTQVTEESRRLLDEVAKDGNGRDSMALSITKQSGQKVAWCSTFESLAPDGPAFHRLV